MVGSAATERPPPGRATKRFQIRLGEHGVALRDGVDGADALRRFAATSRYDGELVIAVGETDHARGRVTWTSVRGTPTRARGTTFETRLEAVVVPKQTTLPTWPEAVTFSTPTPAQSARWAEARRARAARAGIDVEKWPCALCGHGHSPVAGAGTTGRVPSVTNAKEACKTPLRCRRFASYFRSGGRRNQLAATPGRKEGVRGVS